MLSGRRATDRVHYTHYKSSQKQSPRTETDPLPFVILNAVKNPSYSLTHALPYGFFTAFRMTNQTFVSHNILNPNNEMSYTCRLSVTVPSTMKVDVYNCRLAPLTRRPTSPLLWLLRTYWFARGAEGTEGQTVRKDCLALLFKSALPLKGRCPARPMRRASCKPGPSRLRRHQVDKVLSIPTESESLIVN